MFLFVPIATGSIRSRHTQVLILLCMPHISRKYAPTAMRMKHSVDVMVLRPVDLRLFWERITESPQIWEMLRWQTAPAVMAIMTFDRRTIRSRPYIQTTFRRRVGNVIPRRVRTSPRVRFTWRGRAKVVWEHISWRSSILRLLLHPCVASWFSLQLISMRVGGGPRRLHSPQMRP